MDLSLENILSQNHKKDPCGPVFSETLYIAGVVVDGTDPLVFEKVPNADIKYYPVGSSLESYFDLS